MTDELPVTSVDEIPITSVKEVKQVEYVDGVRVGPKRVMPQLSSGIIKKLVVAIVVIALVLIVITYKGGRLTYREQSLKESGANESPCGFYKTLTAHTEGQDYVNKSGAYVCGGLCQEGYICKGGSRLSKDMSFEIGYCNCVVKI